MNNTIVTDYLYDWIHTFQVRTLKSLGYKLRVSLSNNSYTKPHYETDYSVIATIYENKLSLPIKSVDLGILKSKEKRLIDCENFIDQKNPNELIIIFHFLPFRLKNQTKNGLIDISKDELWYLMTAQDHYVEYTKDDGFSSGVLYQCGAFNYDKFSKEASTIVQAPKCHISDDFNTFFSFTYTSPNPDINKSASLSCVLFNEKGHSIHSWKETFQPFETKLIDIKKNLSNATQKSGFFCFYAVSNNAVFLPLTFNYNEKHKLLAVEHSLPPTYYGYAMSGPNRKEVISSFSKIEQFRSFEGAQ